jgi:hypothetical protein
MKLKSTKFGLTIAVALTGCALVSSASAATISENPLAPSGNILVSQLTDLGPGTQANSHDYANNTGPAGQTFQVGSGGIMGSLTIMGRGDSASSWDNGLGGPQPFDGTEQWVLQLGSVNANGSIFVLDTETATGFTGPANIADFLTFTLAHPVDLSAGATYEWTVSIDNAAHTGAPWLGWAHSTGDALTSPGIGSYAMNNDTSMVNPGGGDNNTTPVMGGFAAPNPGNYDYVFAIQGVPEPTTLALIGLGGLGLIVANRRRRA